MQVHPRFLLLLAFILFGFDCDRAAAEKIRVASSSPALTARLLHVTHAGPESARDAREALALGRVYRRAGHEDRARQLYGDRQYWPAHVGQGRDRLQQGQ